MYVIIYDDWDVYIKCENRISIIIIIGTGINYV